MADRYRVERWTAPNAPNSAMLRYALEGEGFDAFQWADRPGIFYGLHAHPEDQSHWIVSGHLELSVKGAGRFQLGPGDRDFMPAGTYHSARVIGDDPVVYLIGIKNSAPVKDTIKKPKRKLTSKSKAASPSTKAPKAGGTNAKGKSASKTESAGRSSSPSKGAAGKTKAKPASRPKPVGRATAQRAKDAAKPKPKTKTKPLASTKGPKKKVRS